MQCYYVIPGKEISPLIADFIKDSVKFTESDKASLSRDMRNYLHLLSKNDNLAPFKISNDALLWSSPPRLIRHLLEDRPVSSKLPSSKLNLKVGIEGSTLFEFASAPKLVENCHQLNATLRPLLKPVSQATRQKDFDHRQILLNQLKMACLINLGSPVQQAFLRRNDAASSYHGLATDMETEARIREAAMSECIKLP